MNKPAITLVRFSSEFFREKLGNMLVVLLLSAFFNWDALVQAEKALPGEVGKESAHISIFMNLSLA
jgi:hypothetical protein